jgi:hypothetical protein
VEHDAFLSVCSCRHPKPRSRLPAPTQLAAPRGGGHLGAIGPRL